MVYVDFLIDYGWKLGPSCHMFADTLKELHNMADKIGVKRSWFQSAENHSLPHYDLVNSKRNIAIELGAHEIETRKEWSEIFNRLRKVYAC